MEALLQKVEEKPRAVIFVLTEEQHPQRSNTLVILIFAEIIYRQKLVIVRIYYLY